MDNPEVKETPDAIPENTASADVNWEQKAKEAEDRRKETQSSYTKGQQKLKAIEAENAKLLEQMAQMTKPSLSEEDKTRLDSLKYEDPDKWRNEVNRLEAQSKQEHNTKLAELTGEARKNAEVQFELDRRQQVLKEFNDSNNININEEFINNEVPPRITKKLANGELSFEEFLTEVNTYVNTDKVVANPSTINQPNMGNMGGGNTPKDMKPEKSLSEKYTKAIY